jgi:uncharacterized membrane protein YccC
VNFSFHNPQNYFSLKSFYINRGDCTVEDNEFKEYVVDALRQIIERQDNTDANISQLRAETKADIQQLRNETKADIRQLRAEMKTDFKRMDKKIDSILEYVEHVDKEFQRHRTAEN